MCGRFTLSAKPQAVADFFGPVEVPVLTPRYNIAPSPGPGRGRRNNTCAVERFDSQFALRASARWD
jgi:hypothetical protein